jgi:hypothetical protein
VISDFISKYVFNLRYLPQEAGAQARHSTLSWTYYDFLNSIEPTWWEYRLIHNAPGEEW